MLYIKALGILLKLWYRSLISDKKSLSGRPNYRWKLVMASTTQARTVRKTTVLE